MSWVKRMPPGDPAYFCDCPPCPFCFTWVNEEGHAGNRRTSPRTRNLVLPVLAGTAFLLTLGLTMRHQNTWMTPLATTPNPPASGPSGPRPASDPPATSFWNPAARQLPAIPSAPASGEVATEAVPLKASASDVNPSELVPVYLRIHGDGEGNAPALKSMSNRPLTVRVQSHNPSNGNYRMVQVHVPPYARVDLAETGLLIEPGDEIALQSPPYKDRTLVGR
jgi:hypothetical protein